MVLLQCAAVVVSLSAVGTTLFVYMIMHTLIDIHAILKDKKS